MKTGIRCTNMNHGRWNAPVRFCPACGESINRSAIGRCDAVKHADLRKTKHAFCLDCGKPLTVR